MILLMWAFLQAEDPISYRDLSEKFQLVEGDKLMKLGRYREAAVQYRNALPGPGDREAVRMPLAIALLAAGDLEYAGLELRRAWTLYDGFDRLAVDAGDLFSSRDALLDRLSTVRRDELKSDGWAALAYGAILAREPDLARRALDRLEQDRERTDFAIALDALRRGEPVPRRETTPLDDRSGFLAKVRAMPEGPAAAGKERIPEPLGPVTLPRKRTLKPLIVDP